MHGKNNLKIIMRKICKEHLTKKNVHVYKTKPHDSGAFCVVTIALTWLDGRYVQF